MARNYSHGYYFTRPLGSISFGRKNRRSFWISFLFGILPDFLAFAPLTLAMVLGLSNHEWQFGEPPDPNGLPAYIFQVYNVSHSLVIFALIFITLWFIFRRPIWEFSAWGLHILFDIPLIPLIFFRLRFCGRSQIWRSAEFLGATRLFLCPTFFYSPRFTSWFFLATQGKKKVPRRL